MIEWGRVIKRELNTCPNSFQAGPPRRFSFSSFLCCCSPPSPLISHLSFVASLFLQCLVAMSVKLDSISLSNPNPNPNPNHSPTTASLWRITPHRPSSQSSSSLRFAFLLGPRPQGVSAVTRALSPIGLGHGFGVLTRRSSYSRLVLASAASREDSVSPASKLGLLSSEQLSAYCLFDYLCSVLSLLHFVSVFDYEF